MARARLRSFVRKCSTDVSRYERRRPFSLRTAFEIPAFQQQRKKTLGEILRLFRPGPLSPDKTINGSPVCPAKIFECFLRCRRSALRREHNAPMGCCKRHAPVSCVRHGTDSLWRTRVSPTLRGLIVNRHVPIQTKSLDQIKPKKAVLKR